MFPCSQSFINKYYIDVTNYYENTYLKEFDYKVYKISSFEQIFCIEDSFLLYVCIESTENNEQHHVKFEELLPNNIFKFIIKDFTERFDNSYYLIFYKKFQGLNNWMQKSLKTECTADVIKMLEQKIPELNLVQRVNNWKGFLYHNIFFELNSPQYKSFAVTCTRKTIGYREAYQKCKDLYTICIMLLHDYRGVSNKNHYYIEGFMFDKYAYQTINDIIMNQKAFDLYEKVRFWITKDYIDNRIDVKSLQIKYLDDFIYSDLYKTPPFTYEKKPAKWKSEYLVYELMQKVYGSDNVVFQYRPYFLNYDGHQLSYDIYVPKKRLAVEYQGKQHFEPVDYFGGESAFIKQQNRDMIKKQLSEQHHIRLIYFNYWEEITLELLKQKLN